MATTSTRPPARRPAPTSNGPSGATNSIARGATARSAVPPRVTSPTHASVPRRAATLKVTAHATHTSNDEPLQDALKQEIDQKEHLLVRLQEKDQLIAKLTAENDNLTSALSSAKTRVNEVYTEQSRMENDLATRIELTEKLRSQVRELEKEKRDTLRRYNEQASTFEAERQSFYDNEQHLKSRIQSLLQARKQPESRMSAPIPEDEPDTEDDELPPAEPKQAPPQNLNDPETEPAEMSALKLELSTMATSYASTQSTLALLQTQLVDLKRVNHELQEENESYMMLLREKTLSGQFDVMKQVGAGSSSDGDEDEEDDLESNAGSFKNAAKPTLESVQEAPEERVEQESTLETIDVDSQPPGSRYPARNGRKAHSRAPSDSVSRGESLADLPITGPGLDLAAELGRAENKDIFNGGAVDDRDRAIGNEKVKRGKKHSIDRRITASEPGTDIDALRTEVKSLKDANKALSLYASKIIDRIISLEGFEHVLAVDYDKAPSPPTPDPKKAASPAAESTGLLSPVLPKRPRPQSIMSFGSSWKPPLEKVPERRDSLIGLSVPSSPNPNPKRRSLSFDWRSFSVFGGGEKKDNPNLRPLTLKPGGAAVVGAKKVDTFEDEDDRKERDRLRTTMKLMGIQPQLSSPSPLSPDAPTPVARAPPPSDPSVNTSRFSFFRKSSTDNSAASSSHSLSSNALGPSTLTQEALEQAEAESKLAALDVHEQTLSIEIARGASGGFTEIAPRGAQERRSRRSRRSGEGSGSGSTVWSAGLSGHDDEVGE